MGGRIKIGELMVRAGLVDELQLNAALAHQRQWGGKLGNVMVELGFVDEELLWKGLAKQTGMQRLELSTAQVSGHLIARVPIELVEKHGMFPMAFKDETKQLLLATSDPANIKGMDEIAFRTGWRVVMGLAPDTEIQWAIRKFYRGDPNPCPSLRKKRAMVEQQEEEEMKLTDMNGNTVMKKLNEIQAPPPVPQYAPPPVPQFANPMSQPGARFANPMSQPGAQFANPMSQPGAQFAQPRSQAGYPSQPPPQMAPPMGFGAPVSMAAGAMFGAPQSMVAPIQTEVPPQVLQMRAELEKGNKFLKSMIEMCISRGLFTQEEYLARLRRE